ncbi:MAG: hypothetical protein AAGD10_11485 [Myxococcota bacterium]
MNEKTAKLIRRYADATGENERDIKRRWNDLDQKARHAFRQEMQSKSGAKSEEAAAEG